MCIELSNECTKKLWCGTTLSFLNEKWKTRFMHIVFTCFLFMTKVYWKRVQSFRYSYCVYIHNVLGIFDWAYTHVMCLLLMFQIYSIKRSKKAHGGVSWYAPGGGFKVYIQTNSCLCKYALWAFVLHPFIPFNRNDFLWILVRNNVNLTRDHECEIYTIDLFIVSVW